MALYHVYMKMPLSFTSPPLPSKRRDDAALFPPPRRAGVGVIFMLRCAPFGHGGLYENAPRFFSSPSTGEGGVGVFFIFSCALYRHGG